VSHYDDLREQAYEGARLKRLTETAPLIAQGKEWLSALRRARASERSCDRVEEAIFWLSRQP